MNYLSPEKLQEALAGILKELNNAMENDTDEHEVLELNIVRDQVDITINQNLDDTMQNMLIENLSRYGGAYERVWFTTRFDGDTNMNFHITLNT